MEISNALSNLCFFYLRNVNFESLLLIVFPQRKDKTEKKKKLDETRMEIIILRFLFLFFRQLESPRGVEKFICLVYLRRNHTLRA